MAPGGGDVRLAVVWLLIALLLAACSPFRSAAPELPAAPTRPPAQEPAAPPAPPDSEPDHTQPQPLPAVWQGAWRELMPGAFAVVGAGPGHTALIQAAAARAATPEAESGYWQVSFTTSGGVSSLRAASAAVIEVAGVSVTLVLGADGRRLAALAEGDARALLSPDAAWLAVSAPARGLWLADLDGSGEVRQAAALAPDSQVYLVDWSPDGRWLYYHEESSVGGRAIYRVQPDGGAAQALLVPWDGAVTLLAVTADHTLVVGDNQGVRVFSPAGQVLRSITDNPERPLAAPARGRYLVLASAAADAEPPGLTAVDLRSGQARAVALPSGARVLPGHQVWSADGRYLLLEIAFGAQTATRHLAVVDAAAGHTMVYAMPRVGLQLHPRIAPAFIAADRIWAVLAEAGTAAQTAVWLLDLDRAAALPPPGPPALSGGELSFRAGAAAPGFVAQRPVSSGQSLTIATGPAELRLQLDRPVSLQWVDEHLFVTGYGVRVSEFALSGGLLLITWPSGNPGEAMRVRLSGLAAPDYDPAAGIFALALDRAGEPRVSLQVWNDLYWQAVGPWDSFDRRLLHLRLVFSREVDPARIEPVLHAAAAGGSIEWEDERTAVWRFAGEPPPLVVLRPGDLTDSLGLPLGDELPAVRLGPPPALVAVEPLGLSETAALAQLLPEVSSGRAAPDGRLVVFDAWLRLYGHDRAGEPTRWLLDRVDGRLWQIAWQPQQPQWTADGRLFQPSRAGWSLWDPLHLDAREGGVAGLSEAVVFPGGGALAALRPAASGAFTDGRILYDLVIYDLEQGRMQVVPDFVWRLPTAAEPAAPGLAVSADEQQVAGLSQAATGAELVLADLRTGAVTTLAAGIPILWSTPSFAPDGAHLVVGGRIYNRAGELQGRFGGDEPALWSPDSRFLLRGRGGAWQGVYLYDLTTGAEQALGTGLPVGWDAAGRALIVRWPGADYRYRP